METDVIIQFGIFFFCIALLTFWFKKRWKKKPEQKARSYPENEAGGKWNKSKDMSSSEDWVGGKWTAERPEPEPPERSKEPEPEPPERSKEPESPERSKEPEPPEKEPKEQPLLATNDPSYLEVCRLQNMGFFGGNDSSQTKCKKCDLEFSSNERLERHTEKAHPKSSKTQFKKDTWGVTKTRNRKKRNVGAG